jgi:putative glutamine amidotransferase
MLPLIGITSGTASVPVAAGQLASCYVGTEYSRAVRKAGGVPVILPAISGCEEALAAEYAARIDGLLLAGGTDIHPRYYGQAIDPALTCDPDPVRDTFELALIARARRARLPILGICRGLQLLNVAYGGSLHQDLPHTQPVPAGVRTLRGQVTDVTVVPGTQLHGLLGIDHARVFCLHHQAIDQVGVGLIQAARAPDGLIEAIEFPSSEFILGVMWHPEQMSGSDAHAPYRALVARAAAGMQAHH